MKTGLEYPEEDDAIRKLQEMVLRVLEARFGSLVTPAVEARVRQMNDRAALEALLVRAATAPTPAEMGVL